MIPDGNGGEVVDESGSQVELDISVDSSLVHLSYLVDKDLDLQNFLESNK